MKIQIVITLIAACLSGCVSNNAVRTAGPYFEPNCTSSVQILNERPDWKHVDVGLVQANGYILTTDAQVYRMIQRNAASIGADAVIVETPFEQYSSRRTSTSVGSNYLISRPLKGIAIARPENVSLR